MRDVIYYNVMLDMYVDRDIVEHDTIAVLCQFADFMFSSVKVQL